MVSEGMVTRSRGDREGSGNYGTALTAAAALRIPGHVIARVFSQLDCVDLLSCSLVCRQWYIDSAEVREGWKNEYLDACTLYGSCSIRGAHSWCD